MLRGGWGCCREWWGFMGSICRKFIALLSGYGCTIIWPTHVSSSLHKVCQFNGKTPLPKSSFVSISTFHYHAYYFLLQPATLSWNFPKPIHTFPLPPSTLPDKNGIISAMRHINYFDTVLAHISLNSGHSLHARHFWWSSCGGGQASPTREHLRVLGLVYIGIIGDFCIILWVVLVKNL